MENLKILLGLWEKRNTVKATGEVIEGVDLINRCEQWYLKKIKFEHAIFSSRPKKVMVYDNWYWACAQHVPGASCFKPGSLVAFLLQCFFPVWVFVRSRLLTEFVAECRYWANTHGGPASMAPTRWNLWNSSKLQ